MDANLTFNVTGRLVAEGQQLHGYGSAKGMLTLLDSAGGPAPKFSFTDGAYAERVAALINAAGCSDLNLGTAGKDAIRARWPRIADDMIAMGFGGQSEGPLMPLAARDLIEIQITRTAEGSHDDVTPAGSGWTILRSVIRGTHPCAADGDKLLWVRSKPIGRSVPRPALVKTAGAMGVAVPASLAAE